MRFFLMSQGSLNPKIRILGQKVCLVAHSNIVLILRSPFQSFRIFSFNLDHQGSVQQMKIQREQMQGFQHPKILYEDFFLLSVCVFNSSRP